RLPGIVATRCPGGFQVAAASEVRIDILAVAQVGGVLIVELVIQPGIEQLSTERQIPDVAEARKDRVRKADRSRAHLIGVLEVGKEEEFVLLDRTAQVDSRVAPCEERVHQRIAQGGIVETRIEGAGIVRTLERGISGDVVIAEEIEPAAMKLIATGAGND